MGFPELIACDKALALFPGWSAPEAETGYIWFDAPIEIGGVVERGIVLHGGCYSHVPDQHVVFELRASIPGVKRRVPLHRIEWRSLTGGHTNRRRKGVPSSGKRVGDTHAHAFELNWLRHEQRMRKGNLPQAEDIEEELQSFESLRSYAGKCLRINNIDIVSIPPWEYSLLHHG